MSSPVVSGIVDVLRRAAWTIAGLTSVLLTIWLGAKTADTVSQSSMPAWTLARASGFASYLLMLVLVLMGLVLSHPRLSRVRRPRRLTQLRIHVALAVFTLAFTAIHIVVLATDPWAHVGWRGAFVPQASEYRPVAVTMGVVAMWATIITVVTAALAGRVFGRIWWAVHKVAATIFVLVWLHGLYAGSDSPTTLWFYLVTGATALVLALSRYSSKTPADVHAEIATAQTPVMERSRS